MSAAATFPLRLEPESMDKLRYLAKKNSRSINKEIEFLVNQHIAAYEKEHGALVVSKE